MSKQSEKEMVQELIKILGLDKQDEPFTNEGTEEINLADREIGDPVYVVISNGTTSATIKIELSKKDEESFNMNASGSAVEVDMEDEKTTISDLIVLKIGREMEQLIKEI